MAFTAHLSYLQVVSLESNYDTLVHGLQERSSVGRQVHHLDVGMVIIQGQWMTSRVLKGSLFLLQYFLHLRYKVMGNKSFDDGLSHPVLALVVHTTSSKSLVIFLGVFVFLAR